LTTKTSTRKTRTNKDRELEVLNGVAAETEPEAPESTPPAETQPEDATQEPATEPETQPEAAEEAKDEAPQETPKPEKPLSTSTKLREKGLPPRTVFYVQTITKPMTAAQVAKALTDAGWPDEGMAQVVACLNYLVTRSKKLTVSGEGESAKYAPVKK